MFRDEALVSQRPVATCRHPNSQGFTLLPQFNVPENINAFPLERAPPQLPSRAGPYRVLSTCVIGMLSVIGVLAVGSWVAEPAMRGGRNVIGNLGNAMGNAIERANEAAERQKSIRQAHARRKLVATSDAEIDASEESLFEKRSRSSLLLRMAALRRSDEASSLLNTAAVQRYFPEWVGDDGKDLKSDTVLKDLIVAVALLAHDSFENDKAA
mgnify:CR=1 FL=1